MNVRRYHFDDEDMRTWWRNAYASGALRHDTFFQSPEWIHCWRRHFVDSHPRREALLLGVEHEGRLVAAAPLFIQSRNFGPLCAWRSIHLIGERLAQYPDILLDGNSSEDVWTGILDFLRDAFPDAWVELRDVLPESTACSLRCDEELPGEKYHRLLLEDLSEDALDAHVHPHMRRELQRARKRLASDDDLSWEFLSAPGEHLLRELIALNTARFGKVSWFAEPGSTAFFLDLCALARDETWCSVLCFRGRVISMLMGHMHGDSMLYLLSGLDEEHKQLSPGTMNLGRTILHAAEQNFRFYDFLRGDEAYKREFAPEQRRSRHLIFVPATARARRKLALRSRGVLDAAKRRMTHV